MPGPRWMVLTEQTNFRQLQGRLPLSRYKIEIRRPAFHPPWTKPPRRRPAFLPLSRPPLRLFALAWRFSDGIRSDPRRLYPSNAWLRRVRRRARPEEPLRGAQTKDHPC